MVRDDARRFAVRGDEQVFFNATRSFVLRPLWFAVIRRPPTDGGCRCCCCFSSSSSCSMFDAMVTTSFSGGGLRIIEMTEWTVTYAK